ncbi:hypothetical protein Tco_1273985 [Tanacetum coccineum]
MALSIADQIALDDALVAPADRLKIGKCNLRLSSDITSKEATLQVVYDVLKLTPFYKAFPVTADCSGSICRNIWASTYVHNDRLGHSGDIRKLSDVNVNKLHQPWRSFAAVINKCLCGTPSYDSLRLSQAQILWGMYNKKSVDYAYLLWEDFIFKIETKSSKKGSAMYYPRFTKIVVNYVMEKDPSIPRRNKVNWHYARDDPIHQRAVKKSSSYASGSGADEGTGVTPGVPDAPDYDSDDDISWKSSDDDQDDEQDQEDDDARDDDKKAEDDDDEEMTESDNDGDDFVHPKLTTHEDEIIHEQDTDEDDSSISSSDEDDSDNDVEGAKVAGCESGEDATDAKDQGNEAVKDSNTDLDGRDKVLTDVEDTHVTLTPVNPDGQQQSSSVSSGFEQVKKEVSKIIPKVEKFVTDQLESEVLVRSSKEANTSHAVAANLSELELKKILIDKMKANNSINRTDIQRQLYKALVEAYEADKILLDTYGDTVTIKRPRDGADDDEEPSAGTDRGSKRRRSGKEPASTSAPSDTTTKTAGQTTSTGTRTHTKSASQSAPVGDAMHSTDVSERPADQEFETGVQDEQAEEEVQHPSDWFQKPTRLPSPDHAWNTSVPAVHESVQPWLSNLAQQDPRESFDELTDSTFDFSAFVLNRLNVQTLTPELLAGPTFELMKGTCKSLTELEYFCEEVYKATTEKLDWINPEGRQYPHDLRQPLPLVPNSQGRRVIPFHHFINNDLEYLRGGVSSRKYSTSVTKTQAADYGHIKWIEDLVPNSMWSQTIVKYDKFALWGVSHWGKKRRQFYAFAALRESARDVYSKRRIIAVTKVEIVEWHDYKHLDWITVRRDDDALYKFKEGDFHRLRIQDIEDMLLLLCHEK